MNLYVSEYYQLFKTHNKDIKRMPVRSMPITCKLLNQLRTVLIRYLALEKYKNTSQISGK